MLDAIERLRSERDQLKNDLEFFQLESKFTIQSLQAKLMHNPSAETISFRESTTENQLQRSQLAMSAMAVTVQHLHAKNEQTDNTSMQSVFELTTKDEGLAQTQRRLADVNFTLQAEKERRHELKMEVDRFVTERDDI